MTGGRQDGWTLDEDTLLAEVILRHIREGSTQLRAFEEVGNLLSRTAAACGFRWNSAIRKQYQEAISLAKRERRAHIPQKVLSFEHSVRIPESRLHTSFVKEIDIEDCIRFLQDLQSQLQNRSLFQVSEENQFLQGKLHVLKKERDAFEKRYLEISDDYQSLLGFFEKARRLAIQEMDSEPKLKFQMDQNGNLERV